MNALGWQEWAILIALLVGVALAVQSLLLLRSAHRKNQAQLQSLPQSLDMLTPLPKPTAVTKGSNFVKSMDSEQEDELLRLSIEVRELREQQRENRQQMRQFEQQLQALREQLHKLAYEWQNWQTQQPAPPSHSPQVSVQSAPVHNALPTSPYNQAVELAKQGYDAAALASNCGISRGEADLIVALYRTQSGHNH